MTSDSSRRHGDEKSSGRPRAKPSAVSRSPSGGSAKRFFSDPAALRAWLAKHHASERELIVGFYKKGTGKPSITWPQLVEECLCYGWIDGIHRSVDEEVYTIRITPRLRPRLGPRSAAVTPRKPTSNWSAVNVKLVERLRREGRMTPAGEAAFAARTPERTERYSFEQADPQLDPAREKAFRAKKRAWSWWQEQPAGYRKLATWYVESAKREETRERRFASVVASAARGERIGESLPPSKRQPR